MKKILFVLSMLVSVAAYSQTTGFFRYDTVRFQKGGGNSEFFLENGTRNVTGGVLTNTGGGRTAFVTPAATTKAINGTTLSLSGDTVLLGGNVLNRYTVIPLNGFPLTINHNGVNNAAAPDSNSIRLTNNTLATSISDSNVTTGIGFYGNSWRTTGSTNKPFAYHIDAIGLGGSGVNGLSQWRIRHNANNTGWGTAFALQATTFAASASFPGYKYQGNITSPLNINGQAIGSFSSNVWFGGAATIVSGTGAAATDNTIMGQSAFNNAVSGTHNVAIGELSMGGTSPNFSTAVGFQALAANDSAYNVGVGYNAMRTNTLGVYNTAVGANALYFNTTGEQNAAFGYNALLNNTTGQKNSAIGPGVMESNTTGSFNTGNGHDALLNQTTGSNNVGIGWLAYGNNITGSLNTVVGFNSFNGVVNGEQNVIIGASATAANDTIDNAIGIGTGVVIPASNAIVIGRASNTTNYQFGIAAGAGTKALRYDPTTRQLFYSDTTTGGGGGGSGTVTSVDPGYGLIGTPDPITTTGTVILDTTIAVNKAGAQVISGAKNFTASPTLSSHTATYLLYAGTGGLVSSTGNMYYDGARAVFGTTAQIGQGASSGEAAGGATYASIGADWVELRPSWLTGSSSAGLRALYFNGSAWQSALEYGFTSGGVATNMSLLKSGGNVGIGIAPASVTAKLHVVDNTVTTGTASRFTSSSITSGSLATLTSTSTAANSFSLLNISSTGANASASRQAWGALINVANTGTTSQNVGALINAQDATTNIGATFSASGGTTSTAASFTATGATNNYAITTGGGNSGFLVGSPTSALHTTSFATAYAAKTTTYPITANDYTLEATSGTFTMTLPLSTGCVGRQYVITNSGAGVITLATTSSETFRNVTATPITLTLNQFNTVIVQSANGAWLRISSL